MVVLLNQALMRNQALNKYSPFLEIKIRYLLVMNVDGPREDQSSEFFSNNFAFQMNAKKQNLEGNKIFKILCPKEKFSSSNECHICKKKTDRNCCYCGRRTCKACLPKKRKDPSNPNGDNNYRICFKCEDLYIQRYMIEEYFLEKKDLEDERTKKEEIFNRLQYQLNSLNTNVENATKNKTKGEYNYQELLTQRQSELQNFKKKVEEIDVEIDKLKQKEKAVVDECSNNQNIIETEAQQLEDLKKERKRYALMITAVKEDIQEYMNRMEKSMDTLNSFRVTLSEGESNSKRLSVKGQFTPIKAAPGTKQRDEEIKSGKKNCNICRLI